MTIAILTLEAYVRSLVERAGKQFKSGEILAKILTSNDDSGRHGVLIPTEHYEFFLLLTIVAADENATQLWDAYYC